TPLSAAFFSPVDHTATTDLYPLSLHDALPIWPCAASASSGQRFLPAASSSRARPRALATSSRPAWYCSATSHLGRFASGGASARSEEHTSELQSLTNLVCRLLLETKKRPNQSP